MIPCIGATICGVTYYPLYNNQAMFRMQDTFQDNVLEQMQENSKAGFRLAFDVFALLCEEGEAVRRHYGYEPGALPDWDEMQQTCLPADVILLKNAVYAAITLGCTREVDVAGEVDLTLLELKKKNG